ncbi:hypothetical protein AcV5_002984 [Taiwanofungus camphoratus]|nr:hypothetical protein AcV5_002984 [Antrodia cinnamomea]KAI0954208.1 hypothetical protein AcV7_007504 [Antrodia cinnamomea]
MVDWQRPDVILICVYTFNQMVIYLLGVYGWQIVLTFHYVEWPLLIRRLKFQFAYIPYLIGRYSLLANLIILAIVTRGRYHVNCSAAFKCLAVLGSISIASASTNLLVRSVTLWHHNRLIQAFLVVLGIGQWCIGFSVGLTTFDSYGIDNSPCGLVSIDGHSELIVLYGYTVVCDFLILVFTVTGLISLGHVRKSRLFMRLHRQGLWYFILTVIVNLVVVVFACLNLNPIMNIMFSIPAVTISVIASSGAVTSLINLKDSDDIRDQHAPPEPDDGTTDFGSKDGQFTTQIEMALSVYRDSSEVQGNCSYDGKGVVLAASFPSEESCSSDCSRLAPVHLSRGVDTETFTTGSLQTATK